jgi:hypothetical protein
MRRLLLAVLIAGGVVAAYLAWDAATGPSRRCEAILDLIRAHAGKHRGEWRDRDAELLWNRVLEFRGRDAVGLMYGIRDAIVRGEHRTEALALAVGIIHYGGTLSVHRGAWSPDVPDPRAILERPFDAKPYQLWRLLDDEALVSALSGSASPEDHQGLLELERASETRRPHVLQALARMIGGVNDLDIAVDAVRLLSKWHPDPDVTPVLLRLTADRNATIRVVALGGLAAEGDPQAARDLLLFSPHGDWGDHVARWHLLPSLTRLAFVPGLPGRLHRELKRLLAEGGPASSGQAWELAERVGSALERAAVEDDE